MQKKLYFYDIMSGCEHESYQQGGVISEIKLPESEEEQCVTQSLCDDKRIPLRKKINLLFGDPRKLNGCKLLSKNAKDAPEEMQEFEKKYHHKIWKFSYKGKSFWACEHTHMRRY